MGTPVPETTPKPAPWSAKTLGLPLWAWIPVGAGAAGLVFIWYRRKQSAAAAASSAASAPTAGSQNTDTSGLATDQYEALLAQIRDLQGSVSDLPTTGPTGPAGPPGPTGPPAKPTLHYAQWKTTTNSPISINGLANRYHAQPADIIAQTKLSEPSDTSSTKSKLYQYIKSGNWNATLPAGYTIFVPYYS